MRYVLEQKLLFWGDNFYIRDEEGRDVYFVDGKAFSLGDQLAFQDLEGNELAYIKQKVHGGVTVLPRTTFLDMRRLLTFVVLVLVVFGCAPQQTSRNARPAPTIDTTISPRLPLLVNRVGPVDTIIGVVSDARTSAGVEDARVMDVGAQRVVTTDKLGRFVLPVRGPGKTVLQTTGTGYRARVDTVDVVTRQGLSLAMPMRPDAVRLAYTCACPMAIYLQVDVRSSMPQTPIPWAIVTVTEKDKPTRRDSVPGAAFVDSVTHAVRINVGGTPASPVTVEVSAPGFKAFRTQVKELPRTVTAVLQPT